MDRGSLLKFNVSQLKAKCKELGLTGYSKLTKAALVENLVSEVQKEVNGRVKEDVTPQPTPPAVQPTSLIHIEQKVPQANKSNNNGEPIAGYSTKKSTKKRTRKVQGEENAPSKKARQARDSPEDHTQQSSSPAETQPNPRKETPLQEFQAPSLPARLSHSGITISPPMSDLPSGAYPVVNSPRARVPPPLSQPAASKSPGLPCGSEAHTAAGGVRPLVKPLAPCSVHPAKHAAQTTVRPSTVDANVPLHAPQAYKPAAFRAPAIIRAPRVLPLVKPHSSPPPRPAPLTTQSFDFAPSPTCTDLPRITIPPSMARRRQAERMSVVFSGIYDRDILAFCVQVSRAWRYAVYLSATHRLLRDFPGSRLDVVLATIKEPRMTSMWAYLDTRRAEVKERYEIFKQSWLGQSLQRQVIPIVGRPRVDARLWASPDDDRQLAVVLRFVSTRLVFALARRHDATFDVEEWHGATVVGADEVMPNEIWRVTTIRTTDTAVDPQKQNIESFYVLFETGEVIGHAPPNPRPGVILGQRVAKGRPHFEMFDDHIPSGMSLRNDWVKCIEAAERGDAPSLQNAITSADRESYVGGISAFWLRSLAQQKDGGLLRTIARRYVLACVEPNSVSGSYKTVMEMARELTSGTINQPTHAKSQCVGLLVSEHHLVESVHLDHMRPVVGVRLHPALALVLTAPGREYFAFRDTGMPIGTSDEGLEDAWRDIMGCDAWGRIST